MSRTALISDGELQILNEYAACYEAYLHEKISKLNLLTASERGVLRVCREKKIQEVPYAKLKNLVLEKNPGMRKKDAKALVRKLVGFGYLKVKRTLRGPRYSVLLPTEDS